MSAEPDELEPRRKRGPISPALLATLRECADKLDRALALKVGVMDSQSRIETVLREQRALVEHVRATLRSLA